MSKEIIEHLLSDSDYTENVKEMLALYFEQNPIALEEWQKWFNPKTGKMERVIQLQQFQYINIREYENHLVLYMTPEQIEAFTDEGFLEEDKGWLDQMDALFEDVHGNSEYRFEFEPNICCFGGHVLWKDYDFEVDECGDGFYYPDYMVHSEVEKMCAGEEVIYKNIKN